MAMIDEIAPGVHRISILMPEINLQFNHFLIVDDEPLLYHTGILGRVRQSLLAYQAGPLMDYMPYTPNTRPLLEGLAALQPRTLATMHGSSFQGDGEQALIDLNAVMKETLGQPSSH